MPNLGEEAILNRVARDCCLPFLYDADEKLFKVSKAEFVLDTDVLSTMLTFLADEPSLVHTELKEHPLVYNPFGGLYALPKMQDAFNRPYLRDETAEVMRDVYADLAGERLSLAYFESFVAPNGSFEARILGSAALHAVAEGYIGDKGWPFNIFEYSTNNADMPEWEVTLYAGIGHVASLAQQSLSQ